MDQSLFLETVTPGLTALLVLTFVCVIVGVFIGVRALTHGRTAPLLGGLVVGPLGLAALGLSRWALATDVVDEETAWRVVFGLIGPLILVPFFALVPAFLHGILAAVAGGRGPNRRWWVAVVAVVPLLVAITSPTVGGWLAGGGVFPLGVLRTVMYAVIGLLTLPALLGGGDSDGGGPEAGAAAGLAFAGIVALGEVGGRALFWFLLLDPIAIVETHAGRLELIARMRTELLSTAELWSVIAVIAAIAVGMLGLVGMSRGGRRSVHAILGALWLVVAPLPLAFGDVPQSAWQQLAAYIPDVVRPPDPAAGAPAAPVAPELPAAPDSSP